VPVMNVTFGPIFRWLGEGMNTRHRLLVVMRILCPAVVPAVTIGDAARDGDLPRVQAFMSEDPAPLSFIRRSYTIVRQ